MNLDVRCKISNALKGRKLSEQTKQLLSDRFKGKHRSPRTEFKKGHNTGKPLSSVTRKKLSDRLKGRPTGRHPSNEFKKGQKMPWVSERNSRITPWNKGKPWADEVKEKIRKTEKGRHLHPETEFKKGQHISPATEFTRERVKSWWENPEYKARVIASRLKYRRPTEPERLLLKLINKHNLPYKYTGDGSFLIAGLNPDFVNINHKKIAIDVFGDYWHTPLFRQTALPASYTATARKAILKEYGWKLVIIWESELALPNAEERILAKLKRLKCPSGI